MNEEESSEYIRLTNSSSSSSEIASLHDETLAKEIMIHIFRQTILRAQSKVLGDPVNAILFKVYMILLSVVGSLSNLLVIIVIHFRDDCMELEHTPSSRAQSGNLKLTVRKVNTKKNSSTKPIYTLILYLAIIDFLTCSLAIPATLVEISLFTKSNEFICKSFEFMRAFGVSLSNFLVILISLERFLLLCKPYYLRKFKEANIFHIVLVVVTVVSLLLGMLSMFTLSVYQKVDPDDENSEYVNLGICLSKHESSASNLLALKLIITFALITGIFLVKIMYIFIFKKALEVKRKKIDRKAFNDRIKKSASRYSSYGLAANTAATVSATSGIRVKTEPAAEEYSYEEKVKPDINRLLMVPDSLKPSLSLNTLHASPSVFHIDEFDGESVLTLNEKPTDGSGSRSMRKSTSTSTGIMKTILRKKSINKHKSFLLFKANIRMALIIFCVTIVYYISVIPWCLTMFHLITYNPFIFYSFFINNSVNPIVYGFFNANFRRCCLEVCRALLYKLCSLLTCGFCCCNDERSNQPSNI